jgi:hypothetical protein
MSNYSANTPKDLLELEASFIMENMMPRFYWLPTSMENKAHRVWRHQYHGEPYVAPVFKKTG